MCESKKPWRSVVLEFPDNLLNNVFPKFNPLVNLWTLHVHGIMEKVFVSTKRWVPGSVTYWTSFFLWQAEDSKWHCLTLVRVTPKTSFSCWWQKEEEAQENMVSVQRFFLNFFNFWGKKLTIYNSVRHRW